MEKSKTRKGGTFTDSSGQGWDYCTGRCRARLFNDINNVRMVEAVSRPAPNACTCTCVLFKVPAGGGRIILESDDGTAVRRVAGVSYTARCVTKA